MSDWETEFDAWWADYLGPRTPRASGEAAWAEMWNRSEDQLATANAVVEALVKLATRSHYYCEDSWYSCPQAEDGCADDRKGIECSCGADEHNAEVARAALAAHERITKTEKDS